ncbi:Tetratricopeptide TPR_2 repeat-containing protein (plasmid) [Crinalium epipsammum PCC 9333]|uniref:Tetratricopeptide TPR_2 repeat-containing protein n=1 Tax=Crinalium epipsammum PCC 9333 TaxID=1173022 RepID=K9W7B4_9CYAN|nr:tetratricopeptide repeat protein [Crinalium epipsammum]AFZ15637.1 Tetratricopeptide TPR_2 repeat-containing protein [Crinalium epipsammum PCC 9333]
MDQLLNLDINSALTQFKLANAWQIQGKFEDAFIRYQETLRLQPDYLPAYQQLGNLMLKQRRMDEALEYYEQALALDFEATNLSFYYQCLGLPKQHPAPSIKCENVSFGKEKSNALSTGKINLGSQKVFGYHRSGWSFAIQSLSSLHNPQGILFDGCLENQFLFQHNRVGKRSPRILAKMQADGVFQSLATSEEKGIIPYQKPWIGFLHNPHSMPTWFNDQNSPQKLFEKATWQASLPHCVGLFALSEHFAHWLREQTGKPVSVLTHPTEIPDKQFDFDQFLANHKKKIVQIGWWLRKLHSIYQLPLAQDNPLNYQKVRLGFLFESGEAVFAQLMKREARIYKIQVDESYLANTTVIQHIPDDQYDDLLSKNIAFVDLYDSSANNAIIECIARATPLLVNPLPAVKEYLGEDYPMYFHTLEEAAEKALDISLILETHHYLKSCETREKLSAEYFLNSFCNSEVYQLI